VKEKPESAAGAQLFSALLYVQAEFGQKVDEAKPKINEMAKNLISKLLFSRMDI